MTVDVNDVSRIGLDMTSSAPLMTATDLAAYLQVSTGTVYNWRTKGVGPRGLDLHGYPRWRQADVDAWLEGGTDARA